MIKGHIQILLASLMLGAPMYSHALTISGDTSYGADTSFSFYVDVDDAYTWVEGLNEPGLSNVSYTLWDSFGSYGVSGVLSLYESSTDAGTVFADSATDSWSFSGYIPITSSLGWNVSADQDQITVFGQTISATGGVLLRDVGSLIVIPRLVSVPEPSILTLMGLGLIGLGFSRRC